jgi:hypothetical protein
VFLRTGGTRDRPACEMSEAIRPVVNDWLVRAVTELPVLKPSRRTLNRQILVRSQAPEHRSKEEHGRHRRADPDRKVARHA